MVNLEKSRDAFNTHCINLTKNTGIDFNKHGAYVIFCVDFSGSMERLYNSGKVQDLVTRLLPVALKFDNDGVLDTYVFSTSCKRCPKGVTINNYQDYVKNEIISKNRYGGTNYSPVISKLLSDYFPNGIFKKNNGKTKNGKPVFVIFVTDGDNSDHAKAEELIRNSANYDIFIQFVGLGESSFAFLEKLDSLNDRPVDNTGFVKVSDLECLPDSQLYNVLTEQYADWLKARNLV